MEQAEIDGLRLVSHHVASCGGGALDTEGERADLEEQLPFRLAVGKYVDYSGEDRRGPRRGRSSSAWMQRAAKTCCGGACRGYAACADLLINTEGKKPEEIAGRIWDEVHHSFSS